MKHIRIYKVTFEDDNTGYCFVATSIEDAIKKARMWAEKKRKEYDDSEAYIEILSVEYELETDN